MTVINVLLLILAVVSNFLQLPLAQDLDGLDLAGVGDTGFDDNFGDDQQARNKATMDKFKRGSCKPAVCGENQEAVHKSSALKFKSPGCTYFGGKAEAGSLTPCCDVWNACHNLCGTTKDFCDETFRRCIHQACVKLEDSDADKEEHATCVQNASLYNVLLKMSQCKQFEDGQKWGCECVDSSEIFDKRKKVLTKFYKFYNPKEVSKVKVLMSRATDASKFAGIFHALFNIYPTSITRDGVEDGSIKSEL